MTDSPSEKSLAPGAVEEFVLTVAARDGLRDESRGGGPGGIRGTSRKNSLFLSAGCHGGGGRGFSSSTSVKSLAVVIAISFKYNFSVTRKQVLLAKDLT